MDARERFDDVHDKLKQYTNEVERLKERMNEVESESQAKQVWDATVEIMANAVVFNTFDASIAEYMSGDRPSYETKERYVRDVINYVMRGMRDRYDNLESYYGDEEIDVF